MDGSSMQSSPDPLSASQTFKSPPKARRVSRVRTSLSHQSSSPKKQTFELDVGSDLSPQKIRVTVEAGESDADNLYTDYNGGNSLSPTPGPISRRRERTTTTTIPVKGLSDSEEETQQIATPKRGRGRPRKSAGTPVPAKKTGRASTSTQKRGKRKSIGDLVDGDDEEDINFELGRSVAINRGKGRSRSRSRKGTKSTPAAKVTDDGASSTAGKKGRGRRKSLLPEELEMHANESSRQAIDYRRESESTERTESMEPMDDNNQYSPSQYSTIRSTTSNNDGDITIARFDPGNETPRQTGWSSPRIIEAPRPSSSRLRSDNYPSPSLSPDKMNFDQSVKESMVEEVQSEEEEEEYEEEGEDGIGELHEFDTIMESEGFSMISVDSVPSLREHLSSPADQSEKPNRATPRNKSLLSVQDDTVCYNDSFSEIPEEILAAATPAKKPQNSRLLSVQNSRGDDSFSSIAPEVLEAATPARQQNSSKPLRNKFLGEIKTTSAHSSAGKRLSATRSQWNDDYEDSFSTIPAAILDAATPAAVSQERSAEETSNIQFPQLRVSPAHPTSPSDTRLLTPDETPSPPADVSIIETVPEQGSESRLGGQEAAANTANDSFFFHSQLPSSPPSIAPRRYTYTAHLRQHRQLNPDVTQTPSIVFSSPSLPPPIQPGRTQPILAPAQEQRPTLSPIARAGRMLQNIVVPSSPRSRSQSLGSPFKSPASERRSSSIIAQAPNPSPLLERRAGPLPKLDLSSHFSRNSSQQHIGSVRQQEDPFRNNNSRHQRSPSPEERQQYSLGLPQDSRYSSDPRLTNLRSVDESVHSENDMSWQAEEEISVSVEPASATRDVNSNGLSPNHYLTNQEQWAAERAEVVKQVETANSDKVIVIDSDDESPSHEEADEDEGFGQLLETLNSSSPAVPKAREPVRDFVEKPRRSKIPSPWRKNSKRLVYSDELSQPSPSPTAATLAPPEDIAKEIASQPVTVRRMQSSEINDDAEISADLSGWQIPQKANFKPQPRETSHFDLSALLAASPPKRLPVLSRAPQPSFTRQETISSRPSSRELPSQDISSSIESKSRQPTGFTPIPQKQGFNPRPRAPSISQPVFGDNANEARFDTPPEPSSSSVSRPLSASSPSRTNTLSAYRTPSAQVSPLNSHQDSSQPCHQQPGPKTTGNSSTQSSNHGRLKIRTLPP
ncbi:uncharacterized protein PAC_08025 [Phialocephala subalpina]|uniref:Uncharacterized protein n=1 Tax=Phialocephala subalpina TaxID=576137 RepID=A0A1L7WZE2_9HELO|nr:uncharacterized protein PAC_08025 [Phialocephala subalpina]